MRIEEALIEHHWPPLFETFGVDVSYSRGGSVLADSIQAIKGIRATEMPTYEFTIGLLADDFIVKNSDLISFGIGEPLRKDIIEWTDYQGVLRRFEVNLPGDQRQYDYLDQLQILVRIHTKEINV